MKFSLGSLCIHIGLSGQQTSRILPVVCPEVGQRDHWDACMRQKCFIDHTKYDRKPRRCWGWEAGAQCRHA